MTAGAVTQLMEGLTAGGLIEVTAHPSDARSKVVALTADAHEQLRLFERELADGFSPAFAALSDAERTTLARLLPRP